MAARNTTFGPEVATTTPDLDAVQPLASTIPGATIFFLVAADGEATQKLIVLPSVNIPQDLVPYQSPTLSFQAIGQRHLNELTFKDVFLSHIVPAIDTKRKVSAPPLSHVIHLMDGALYHKHSDVLKAEKDNLIDLIFIPPDTSRFTQPVDQSINATFRNIISQYIPDHITVGAVENRRDFMRSFLQATDSALSHRSIQHSFEVCGLHPLNPDMVLQRVPDNPPDFVHLQQNHQRLVTIDLDSLFYFASDNLDDIFIHRPITHTIFS
ncbi:hypothetical protein BLNAU_19728 [Blattamonas nauphoetae]|uniref:DDE-1 domain-containing protein n=1 Tax=Blattamonas nauphoetae TaxID=2049346 RepID=A0ABQ9X1V6_9EUKA|nr:hypothetical protein BLNAU_19728 [Blattamonas nauphoetae]